MPKVIKKSRQEKKTFLDGKALFATFGEIYVAV